MGRKQDDSSVFLGTKAFRKERLAEWWCLPFCLDGVGYYPSCHLWQDLVALPPQRGEEEMCQVKVKACCFGRGLLLFTQQSGRAAAPHQTTCLWVSKQHGDVCMKWAAGHRWEHIPPELLSQACINVWWFCFCVLFLLYDSCWRLNGGYSDSCTNRSNTVPGVHQTGLMCGSYSACVVKSIHYSVVNLQFNSLSGVLSQMILMQTDCQDVS